MSTMPLQNTSKGRSSRSEMFFKIDVLKNFVIFTGKHLCWVLFLIKLQVWRSAPLLKRDSNTVIFLWILQNFLKQFFYRAPLVTAPKRSYWNPPQGFGILMNIYEFFKFSALGSISQYGKYIMSNASSL